MYKVALWGLGNGYNMFTQLHGHDMVDVVAIADKQGVCYKKIDGIPVIRPEELQGICFDYLIVSVMDDRIFKQIINEAMAIGIKREMILPLRIFQISFFDFDDYIKIKNSNVSILSDYCFAGRLYHSFGLKFTSPTINMFADNENYFRFLQDIEGHMKEPMVEVENIMDNLYNGMYSFPRGRVGDSEWEFNHDIGFETAAERWKRGVERFNWDNYIVIMTIQSDEMAYNFDALPIKHKIGFYWKNLHLDSILYMPEWNNPAVRAKLGYIFSGLVNRVADERSGIRAVNWMKALLHQDGFSRCVWG